MGVPIVDPNGDLGEVDEAEYQEVLRQNGGQLPKGWSLPRQDLPTDRMMMGHKPFQNKMMPSYGTEHKAPSKLETVLRALGNPAEIAAGQGRFTISPVTGGMVPMDEKYLERFDRANDAESVSRASNPGTDLIARGADMAMGGAVGGGVKQGIQQSARTKVAPKVAGQMDHAVTQQLRKVIPEIQKITAEGTEWPILQELLPGIVNSTEKQLYKQALGPKQAIKDLAPAVGNAIGTSIGGPYGTHAGGIAASKLTGATKPELLKQAWLHAPFKNLVEASSSPAVANQAARPLTAIGADIGGGFPVVQDIMDLWREHVTNRPKAPKKKKDKE